MFHNQNQTEEINIMDEWMNDYEEKITLITTGYDSTVNDFLIDIYVNHELIISDVYKENLGMEMDFQGIRW